MKHYYQTKQYLLCLLFILGIFSITNAQTYVNGILSTGATAERGTAAPAGYTWSEIQHDAGNLTQSNTNAGYTVSQTFSVADDFTVTGGGWNLTNLTVYGYVSGFAGTTSPFTSLFVRIRSGNPLTGPSTIVFGDLTTNRMTATSDALMYRLFNSSVPPPGTAPGTTRRIWKIEAAINISLPAGTYWVEYRLGAGTSTVFTPSSTPLLARTLPGFNAIQLNGAVWSALIDDGTPVSAPDVAAEMVFSIDYTTGSCSGTPAPGNTISSANPVCPGVSFALSLQNVTPGAGVTYQWQTSPDGTTWTNVPTGGTGATYSATQTVATYYRANVTCAGNTTGSNPVQVTMNVPTACYCTAGAVQTTLEKISNVTFNTINNNSTSTAGYENFLAISTSVNAGAIYPISVSISNPFATDQVIAWIDFNQDGDWTDAGEQVYISALGVGPHTGSIAIPLTATLGTTRMRIRMHDAGTGAGGNNTPCGTSTWGQVEDYTINILAPLPPCSGTPAPGNTLSSLNPVCPTNTFTLSLQNTTPGSGVSYQWQSSPNGTAWTNVPTGGTFPTYTTTQTAATYYRANVTCGAATTASTPIQVTMGTCYCTAGATSTGFEKISNVTFNTINNNSTSTAGYENFTAISTTVGLGANYPISVSISGGFAADQVIVFVDYNQDGDFTDAGETVYTSALGVGPHTGNFTIPATATVGNTRMRVRMHDTSLGPNATSCGTSTFGQVEDYTLNIAACVTSTITTQPANSSVTCGTNTSFNVVTSGSAVTYQWQVSTDGGTTWNNLTNVAPYSGVTTATLSLTAPTGAVNGYRYRVIMNSSCTVNLTSNGAATLTITPTVPPGVSPAAVSVCRGTLPAPLITVSSAPPTRTVSSGPMYAFIPDNNMAGVNHTLTMAGVPAAAVVTAARVQFTIPHTFTGDLVMVLKAPNGQILNLDYFLTTTYGGQTTGFTNTIISSAGVTPLSAGVDPWTGTFKADAYVAIPTGGNGPTGPTGFLPTTALWAPLYTVPNGAWTLAIRDGGAIDTGSIRSWSLTLDYTLPPAQATFTPSTGLFTDANATTAYTGGLVSQIYAYPTATTTYAVTTGVGACASAPTNIVVTVLDPPAITTQPVNRSGCIGSSTTFTVAATGGQLTYQWQLSTDGGVTWNNVSNGTNYSGVTTNTLTVQNIPATWINYRYRVVVTGGAPCGSVNSNSAALAVNPNPVLVVSANPSNRIYPGQVSILTVAVSPNPASTYTWFRDGVIVPGATGNMLTVNVDQLGSYTVRVNDINGCISTSTAVSIADSITGIMFIYPSPNTGQFQVRYYSSANNVLPRTLNIYDSKGARVFTKYYSITRPYDKMDVDMRNFGKGIYMVELGDRHGARIKTGRVVIN